MGFNKVYRLLQEIFPEIDARLLRAVAIEHSKDADAAVEIVLSEIIPFFMERSTPSSPLIENMSIGETLQAPIGGTNIVPTVDGQSLNAVGSMGIQDGCNVTVGDLDSSLSSHDADDGNNEPLYDTYYSHCGQGNTTDGDNVHTLQTKEDLQTSDIFLLEKLPESEKLGTQQVYDAGISQNVNIKDTVEHGHLETEASTTTNKENENEKSLADGNTAVLGVESLTVDDQSMYPSECSIQLGVIREIQKSDLEGLDASLSNDTGLQMETGSSTVSSEDANLNDSMSQASQMRIIEVLEQALEDAKAYKTTVSSAMQPVISLMKEVECKKQAAEQAMVEAAIGGNDILAKVEEVKQTIQHAKEANSMHAGEVYGEKSILASELRELQSRVLSLSDERDKSLSVLVEMHHALELQIAEAEDVIKSAEQMKVEKENAAMKALADEELIMGKVMHELEVLKQQVEENAKLQEFLVSRGRIVDMLQGEIGVVCQDVRLLKEKLDDHIHFSKSVSNSVSSGKLAYSLSSLEVEAVSDSLEATATTTTTKAKERHPSDEQQSDDDGKAVLEGGWDLCENENDDAYGWARMAALG
ncbi:uncharacterized protein LOC127259710 [Andrographis paniculata]|uniref:uncharacterized protein LOC127259710 n=1 Tax=Andrographis paniculata TaxID=175694 RepID=UPI0021E86703|nr:uncharacterized protein LOC127259710 [Andrographis paniculata]XP_051143211.1 uncharacterized protein LOC127259710 [Andrographis paniculata]XP_051143212.1 uncharacterized protein LOC127259710 [Andrographis paniculata]XP_051143213.1 uncharacterized protein LOC127259710 [Andrographis paniculata]